MKALNYILWVFICLCFVADSTFSLLAGGDADASGHEIGMSAGFIARQSIKILVAFGVAFVLYSFFKNKKWSRKVLEIGCYFFIVYIQIAIFAAFAVGNGDHSEGSFVWLPFVLVDLVLTGLLVLDIKYLRSAAVRGSQVK